MLVDVRQAVPAVEVALAYATPDNLTGRPIYRRDGCYLHADAVACLARAADLARPLGYRLKLLDAFRPVEAQWALWEAFPIPGFVSDPRTGSVPHCRGVAVDLTLIDSAGRALEMGTGFDDPSARAWHGDTEVSPTAQRNRFLLLGIMSAAGWDFYSREWWHYQLFQPRRYPVLSDSVLSPGLVA